MSFRYICALRAVLISLNFMSPFCTHTSIKREQRRTYQHNNSALQKVI